MTCHYKVVYIEFDEDANAILAQLASAGWRIISHAMNHTGYSFVLVLLVAVE